jgi:putative protease
MGVKAIKIEGRQRSPTYVAQVVSTLRTALDAAIKDPERYSPKSEWQYVLAKHAEGSQVTQGAFERPWK